MHPADLPPLPLDDWRDTKTTLHLFSQIVGKIRLKLNPHYNHWWHVPLYVSPRGLTTAAMPYPNGTLELIFDFIDHRLSMQTSGGVIEQVELTNRSVASFYADVFAKLGRLGTDVTILSRPFDPSRAGSDIPFADDTIHASYDEEYVTKFHRVLQAIEPLFREFRGRFLGKCSPVHFFWHSFDLAVTRFSGRATEVSPDADSVTREAYSHEVISHGFWVGDDNLPEPAFYSYTAPEPAGLRETVLRPEKAFWVEQNGASMAILKYEDFRTSADPKRMLLDFLQSSYEAGATLANWPREELELSQV